MKKKAILKGQEARYKSCETEMSDFARGMLG